jgi:hypothetical protein
MKMHSKAIWVVATLTMVGATASAQNAVAPTPTNWVWVFSAGPKGSLAVGTQRKQEVGGSLSFKYEPNHEGDPGAGTHQRLRLDINSDNTLITKPGSSVRTHAYDAEVGYLYYLSRHVYLASVAEGYHNSGLSLYLQQSYGGGLGASTTFGERTQQKLEVTADVRGVAEHFYSSQPAVTFAAVRLGEEYVIHFGQPGLPAPELSVNARYIPAIDQAKAWQARGAAALTVPIGKIFSMKLMCIDDYMENTPRKNYLSTSVGVNVDIRK